ncbi:F-box/kelch-repeat protein At3g23880 [Arachis duranensis]|uniref:F-box/kelch-repeat protein At3g23880 n=1 Tax=Arachis duranensis TaxID=130453 RepID=A0A9C6WVL1_ARADU|nr:F-box/kelch-repeat protein At3g23880 [Arachis duranensis]
MQMEAEDPTAAVLLCEVVVMEILSWLTRLKLVCKSWNSIISDPHFVKLQLHRSPKNAILLFTPLDEENKWGLVFSSVESFIQNPSSTLDAQENRYSLHVNDWVVGYISENSPCLRVNMLNALGFGYDESSGSYKVLAIIWDSSGTLITQVYSFGGSSWKRIKSFPAFPFSCQDNGYFIGGTLNWIALRNPHGADYDWYAVTLDMLMLVSFDLKSDTSKQIPLPKGIDEIPGQEPTLGVWGNSLYLLHDYNSTHFIAWQMKEFGDENSWTQLLKISFHHLGVECLFPGFVLVNGNVFMLRGRHDSEAVFYDRRDNSVKRVNISSNTHYIDAFDYVESLVQLC